MSKFDRVLCAPISVVANWKVCSSKANVRKFPGADKQQIKAPISQLVNTKRMLKYGSDTNAVDLIRKYAAFQQS